MLFRDVTCYSWDSPPGKREARILVQLGPVLKLDLLVWFCGRHPDVLTGTKNEAYTGFSTIQLVDLCQYCVPKDFGFLLICFNG